MIGHLKEFDIKISSKDINSLLSSKATPIIDDVPIPDEWMEKVSEPKSVVYYGGYHGGGNHPRHGVVDGYEWQGRSYGLGNLGNRVNGNRKDEEKDRNFLADGLVSIRQYVKYVGEHAKAAKLDAREADALMAVVSKTLREASPNFNDPKVLASSIK